ncbi:pectinesterase-like [Henckelia pumila]|uniref:pectinesterase-like n=1 Tax=Henckelia pumila TaxID=405737 RepID=UPI003C6DFF36
MEYEFIALDKCAEEAEWLRLFLEYVPGWMTDYNESHDSGGGGRWGDPDNRRHRRGQPEERKRVRMRRFNGEAIMKSIKMNLLCITVICLVFVMIINGALAQSKMTLIVSKDGRGNFNTIAEAVAATPNNSPQRTVIEIRKGVYYENIIVAEEKTNICFVGDGMNLTIISGHKNANIMRLHTWKTTTVQIRAAGFIAKYITFENTAGPKMKQAVALASYGDHSAFYKCRFSGYQDTLNPQMNTQFYRECEVYGTVDFIFGNAKVLFQNCRIYAHKALPEQSNTITAQGRESANKDTGTVMQNCNFSGTDDLNVKTYLGRPWKSHSRTVIMKSFLGELIDPRGWLEWPGVRRFDNVYDVEFDNHGPGAALSKNQRANWSHVIYDRAEAVKFTTRNFIDSEHWIKSTGIPYYPDFL